MEHLVLSDFYSNNDKIIMLQVAARSIKSGLEQGIELDTRNEKFEPELLQKRATFITLEIASRLRGCIGSLEAYRPLISDISSNAYSAAFKDPRFPPLDKEEYPRLEIHISILSPAEEIAFDSEQSLLEQLQPGVDGLILSDRGRRSTFLPSVWEQLPDKTLFLSELKHKAGLDHNHWSDTIQFERYSTYSFGDDIKNIS